jgi:hypothetical protein
MGVVIMELNSTWKWVVLTELQWVALYIQWVAILQLMQLVHENSWRINTMSCKCLLQLKNWVVKSIAKHTFFS